MTSSTSIPKPLSATYPWINFTGMGIFLGFFLFYWPRQWPMEQQAWLALLMTAIPIIFMEQVRAFLRKEHYLQRPPVRPFNIERVLLKLVGMLGTYALAYWYYWQLPHYRDPFYNSYFWLLRTTLPYLLSFGVIYLALMDRYDEEEKDGYTELGQLLIGNPFGRDWRVLGQHFLGWLVKLYFLPLMFAAVAGTMEGTQRLIPGVGHGFVPTYEFLYSLCFLLDVLFAAVGYVCCIKLLDSHIRSTEPTAFGWLAALVCYQPFWTLMRQHYFDATNLSWGYWLHDNPYLYVPWGIIILTLTAAYVWATSCFGIRFSNLTYRGLIAHGPYGVTKHPGYVAKNLSWWFISMPFMMAPGAAISDTIRFVISLFGTNIIYFLRAYTEERHLVYYPEYRAYCQWMDKHGWFRWFPMPKAHWKNFDPAKTVLQK